MRPLLALFAPPLLGITRSAVPLSAQAAGPLHLDVYAADSNAFGVTSTLIAGPTEAILVDAQFRISDAKQLADRVAATGRRLKAIVVTHPHPDHYFGLGTLLQRFPGTPVYISAAGARDFAAQAQAKIAQWSPVFGTEVPRAVPTPRVLPADRFTVDGQTIEVIADLQGDELVRSNSVVWVPSLGALITGDVAFQGTHVWLAESTPASRTAWLASLRRLGGLHPRSVVPGHKRSGDLPNDPAALRFTAQYIEDFGAAQAASTNVDSLTVAMQRKYPNLGLPIILTFAARAAFPN